ncbi:hypothetical protein J7E38_20170 [Bacillus sp. ISL-35]|uniref:hypothetical protein n=1 Tax=Bacillus sp. ISL-35 TaxID=2819122 RepID=UPI001BEB68AB|nr:hypothetical protein [Bacillus sp. ISL-35]MBT2681283.1 hypothetical protein [Bacillus sp. ISL-35]MBT2705510.1 hypothetical protein [Chryseobacterium sp. ISL-80]
MKRVLSMLFLLIPLVVLGCSQQKERFDHTTLKEELKEEGITPKLPTKFPMIITGYERVTPPHETNIIEVIFNGKEGGMQFSLTIQPPPVEYVNAEGEDVNVNGNNGFYIKGPGPSIHWTDGDYHYILTSYSEENGTKEKMIETAESFQ